MQMKEGLRYLENAREILKNAPIQDNTYTDVKYVQEACSTAYLAILKTIDEFLKGKEWMKKNYLKVWTVTEKCYVSMP